MPERFLEGFSKVPVMPLSAHAVLLCHAEATEGAAARWDAAGDAQGCQDLY